MRPPGHGPRRSSRPAGLALVAVALAVAATGLAGCGGERHQVTVQTRPPGAARPAGAELADLTGLDPVAAWFAAGRGQARLVLALSPT